MSPRLSFSVKTYSLMRPWLSQRVPERTGCLAGPWFCKGAIRWPLIRWQGCLQPLCSSGWKYFGRAWNRPSYYSSSVHCCWWDWSFKRTRANFSRFARLKSVIMRYFTYQRKRVSSSEPAFVINLGWLSLPLPGNASCTMTLDCANLSTSVGANLLCWPLARAESFWPCCYDSVYFHFACSRARSAFKKLLRSIWRSCGWNNRIRHCLGGNWVPGCLSRLDPPYASWTTCSHWDWFRSLTLFSFWVSLEQLNRILPFTPSLYPGWRAFAPDRSVKSSHSLWGGPYAAILTQPFHCLFLLFRLQHSV